MNTFALPISLPVLAIFFGRAGVALLLGAFFGAERQRRSRMAGLRTNALVALGAALFEMLALFLAVSPNAAAEHSTDFTRVTAYVVSGVGFLGAGVIIRDGVNVRGINTAATIWRSAAVGALSGTGYLIPAAIGALTVLIVHLGLRPIAHIIDRQPPDEDSEVETAYRFEAVCHAAEEAHVRALVTQAAAGSQFHLRALRSDDLEGARDLVRVRADLIGTGRNDIALEEAVNRLSLEPSVTSGSGTVENGLAAVEE